MAIAKYTKNVEQGGSTMITIPADIRKGERSSLAGNRILLVDPRGEIDPNDLLGFMEEQVELCFWQWLQARKKAKAEEEAQAKPAVLGTPKG